MPKGPIQYLIIGCGFLAVVFVLWFLFGPTWGPRQKTPAELRAELQSTSAETRAAAADQLGHLRDFDAMPLLLPAMDDESAEVRGRAGAAVGKILGVDFYYRADDPPVERRQAVARLTQLWEVWQKKGIHLRPGAEQKQ